VIGNSKKEDLWITKENRDLPGPACYEVPCGFVPKKVSIGIKIEK
jgi:hypothetical protein